MRKLTIFLMMILLSACKDSDLQYNGYIDAELTYLSSNFAGQLTDLSVTRGQPVHKDQLLFKLEQTSEQYGVERSQFAQDNLLAQRNAILNQIHYENINDRRTLTMRKQNAASQNDVDVSKKNIDVLNNQLKAIDFQIKSSQVDAADKQWQVSRKEAHSTDNGIIFDTYFTPHEYVQAGQPVVSLVTKHNIKIIFYVPEKALSQIALNDTIHFSSDGSSKIGTGTIRYISNVAQYTPPMIYSREERQNLLFRVEASIDAPDLTAIHLGQPVSLEIVR